MPMNGFNIGRDVTLDIVGQDGKIVALNLITTFDAKQMTDKVTIRGLDGHTRFLEIPDGWDGTIGITRGDRVLDDFIASLEENYYAGKDVIGSAITETIREVGGGISQWRYEGIMFKLDDAGAWKGNGDVQQKLSWVASRKRRIV
jgi:hypothetical protein